MNLLIDDPESRAYVMLKLRESDEHLQSCIEEKFEDKLVLYALPLLKHDLRTQRFSPKRIDWTRNMIPILRKLFECLYGGDYSLLVDLHVLLDMADKWCCDDELLEDWAKDVGIDPVVLDYYVRHRETIDGDLKCTVRLRQNRCGWRNVARMLRLSE